MSINLDQDKVNEIAHETYLTIVSLEPSVAESIAGLSLCIHNLIARANEVRGKAPEVNIAGYIAKLLETLTLIQDKVGKESLYNQEPNDV